MAYRIAEHPAAPGMPHGQEGRAGIVYRLVAPADGAEQALKVFKPRFRLPYLVAQAERIAPYADLPGLAACRRTVLTPQRHAALLRQHPDLTYAVLMPWIEGPTWQEVLLAKKSLAPEQSLALARGLAEALMRMEERGIAHCDLSAPNVMLPALAPSAIRNPQSAIELVDLEGLYAPGMLRPQALSSGSAGYAHRQAADGLWGPEADRFAGALLLAEMLGWGDPQVVQAAWGESYFDPAEMQTASERYRLLTASLQRTWGEAVVRLFERAWRSDTLADCPTFGEWVMALPGRAPVGAERRSAPTKATDLTRAQVQALMEAARRLEEKGNLEGALESYRKAQELSEDDLAFGSLAQETVLVARNLEGLESVTVEAESRRTVETGTSQRTSIHRNAVGLWVWPVWTIITAVGTSLGYTLFNFVDISSILGISKLPLIWALSDLIVGFVTGIGQWLVLRHYLPRIGGWIFACALGSAAGGLVGGSVWEYLLAPSKLTTASWGAFSDLIGGLLRGLSQWAILRRYIRYSEGWILIVAVGWAMGWIINGIWSWNKGWTIQGAVVGFVSGAITGALLLAFMASSDKRTTEPSRR